MSNTKQTADEWWTELSKLLAKKMKTSGVKLFHLEQTERGTISVLIEPMDSPANAQTKVLHLPGCPAAEGHPVCFCGTGRAA